jgi:DNA processing protein
VSRGGLPQEAYAAALAGLDQMTPRRLGLMTRSGEPLGRIWEGLASGRPARRGILARLAAAEPAALAAWEREAPTVDVAALWRRCAGDAVLILGHPGYPEVLERDPLPPAVLFARGEVGLLHELGRPAEPSGAEGAGRPDEVRPRERRTDRRRRSVAVVGTRNATAGGLEAAAALGRDLAAVGVSVVSGLAKGIDGAAHRGALAARGGAPPIGVVASGLDVVYPRQHAELWEEVSARGLLCTEAPPGTRPAAHRFPARNRILAALAELLVVVESRRKGGSLLTVTEAERRGLPIMAVPGSIRSPASEGSNLLLVDGATPVLELLDVVVALGLEDRPAVRRRRVDRRVPPDPGDRDLLELLGTDAVTLDTLVLRSGRAIGEVAVALGRLEAAGWLARSGAWFELTGAGRA